MGLETILAIGGLAASAGSAVIGAAGAQQQAAAQKQAADYQAQVARNNATIAQAESDRAQQEGQQEAQKQNQKTAALEGSLRAGAAANGLDVNVGSPVDLRSSAASLGELDALTIQNNAAAKAAGYTNQANSYLADAQLDTMKGQAAESAGTINTFSSIIGGASSFSDKWASYTQKGLL